MLTIEKINNLYKMYTIEITGGYRSINKIGMSQYFNENGTVNKQSLLQALQDVLEGIEVVSYDIKLVNFDGHIQNNKRYYISVETLQGKNKESYTMNGYIVFNGTYDMGKFKN